jgi:hypothetical protein
MLRRVSADGRVAIEYFLQYCSPRIRQVNIWHTVPGIKREDGASI